MWQSDRVLRTRSLMLKIWSGASCYNEKLAYFITMSHFLGLLLELLKGITSEVAAYYLIRWLNKHLLKANRRKRR